MRYSYCLLLNLLLSVGFVAGCAGAARDTTGFAIADSTTVSAPFVETWQATKAVLREMDLDIYTRDKRGSFVAYTGMSRRFRLFTPHRTELTITLEPVSSETTRVTIETMKQVYGVTLLTYPDWHDRKTTDSQVAQAILEALQVKVS
jgi:hypothetical protein